MRWIHLTVQKLEKYTQCTKVGLLGLGSSVLDLVWYNLTSLTGLVAFVLSKATSRITSKLTAFIFLRCLSILSILHSIHICTCSASLLVLDNVVADYPRRQVQIRSISYRASLRLLASSYNHTNEQAYSSTHLHQALFLSAQTASPSNTDSL
jgi:hypothetical protein